MDKELVESFLFNLRITKKYSLHNEALIGEIINIFEDYLNGVELSPEDMEKTIAWLRSDEPEGTACSAYIRVHSALQDRLIFGVWCR